MKIKNFLILLLTIAIVSSSLLPRIGPDEPVETFLLHGDYTIRISIEKGWARNGWIPVVLSVGNLELYSRMKESGEMTDEEWRIHIETGEIRVSGTGLPFTIYEQNPVRTRLRLIEKNQPVLLELNREKKQAVLYIGDIRWRVDHIRVRFEEAGPDGLYQLTFGGKAIHTHKRLFLEPAAGTIYAVRHGWTPYNFDIDETLVWGIKVHK